MRPFALIAVIIACTASTAVAATDVVAPPPPKAPTAQGGFPLVARAADQINPALVYSPLVDHYVVVWEDAYDGGATKSDIMAGFFGKDGGYLGGPIEIASGGDHARHRPNLVANESNADVLTVYEYDYSATDIDVYASLMLNNGPATSEFIIANSTAKERYPVVARNTISNEYLVVWQQWVGDVEFGTWDIYGRRVSANGLLAGGSIALKAGAYSQITPQVVFLTSRNQYAVMWADKAVPSYPRLYEQRFDANLNKVGDEINSTGFGANANPNWVYNPIEDEYVFVFENTSYGPPDSVDAYVTLNSLANGVGFGGPIVSPEPYDALQPAVTYNAAARNYAIVWEVAYNANDHDIYMELYEKFAPNSCCRTLGPIVVTNSGYWEANPAVASSPGKTSLVVWEDARDSSNGLDLYGALIWHRKTFLPRTLR